MKYNTQKTYTIYWKHAKKYKLAISGAILGIVLGDVIHTIGPYYFKKFIDALSIGSPKEDLVFFLVVIFISKLLYTILKRGAMSIISHFQANVMRDLTNTCFSFLHKHSFSFFQNNFVGSLVKRVGRFSQSFERITTRLLLDLLPAITNVGFSVAVLSFIHVWLGVIILVWVAFFCTITYAFIRFKLKHDINRSLIDTKVTGVLADTVTNHGNVKLLGGYERETHTFGTLANTLAKIKKFTGDIGNLLDLIQGVLMACLEISIMYYALLLWEKGTLSIGDFALIQTYLLYIYNRLWNFGRIFRDFYEALAEADEMTEILDTPLEITDSKQAKKLIVKKGEILFKNISFYYHKTRRVIHDIHISIKPKERIALIGPSGAGKSTLIKLLLRQHDTSGGDITIDGQKISMVTQESLWANISLVPQDPMLFHRTLLENIRYGKPDATDEEVYEAAKLAHCHEFIQKFPEQYNTYVGERGMKLSGGERQRVAIARAILRNTPILILDEATSSLDSESEMFIQEALDDLMKNKTVIVIAHRLSTIMKMNRILVLDKGTIIEEGTHEQLLKKPGGLYKKLWTLQAGKFLYT